jgi:hypothetical protein
MWKLYRELDVSLRVHACEGPQQDARRSLGSVATVRVLGPIHFAGIPTVR